MKPHVRYLPSVICALVAVMLFPYSPALSAPPNPPIPEWTDTNASTAFDPTQQRGRNPVYSSPAQRAALGTLRQGLDEQTNVGSSNFHLTVPIVRLAGRGLDLALDLHYNSRLWHLAGRQITFNVDGDWIAPGWSLGLGKMIRMGSLRTGVMLVDADGTRHPFTGSITYRSGGLQYLSGHTTDGSLINYFFSTNNGQLYQAAASYPDGSVVVFGAATWDGGSASYPTRIRDANGNFISITYRNNVGPQLDTITGILGRVVRFYYDGNGLLTAVTGPGLNGTTRTLLRLHYRQLTLNYGFASTLRTVIDTKGPRWMVDAIYYPATGTGYWFGDADSFSAYGMLAKVIEQRAMSFTAASLTDQGTVTAGTMTRKRVYNYPLLPDSSLTDAPAYTTMTETWDSMDTAPAVTSYVVQPKATPRRVEETRPDGTRTVQLSYNAPGQFGDGLVYQTETYNAANSLLQKTVLTWEPGADGAPRVKRTEVTDERNQTPGTEVVYGASYDQVAEVRAYDYDGTTVLRKTLTTYENSTHYISRGIYNLPKTVEVYQYPTLPTGNPASRIEYSYDGQSLAGAPGVVQHDDLWDPNSATYDSSTDYRGNLTQVKTYADAQALTGAVIEARRYDIAGNLVSVSGSSCCEQLSYGYTAATQYAYPTSVTRGAVNPASPARLTETAIYDFNTGLTLSATDTNGRTTTFRYDATSSRPTSIGWSTGAMTSYQYDDAALAVTTTTGFWGVVNGVFDGYIGRESVSRMNGLGLVRRQETLAEGGAWDIVETQYDALGRVRKQSRPFHSGQTPQWSELAYDGLARVTTALAPDGSEAHSYYNEATRGSASSNLPGQTVRTVDPWGRERWARRDALGSLVEVVEPNPNGTGSVSDPGAIQTSYQYNAFGQVVQVWQGPNPPQSRSFRYDSLGRLTHQKLAEENGTLDIAGVYGGEGRVGATSSRTTRART